MAFLHFIIRRATRHWHLLLTLSLGVILATALLASGPLLVDTVVELGLQHTLQGARPQEAHLRLTMHTLVDEPNYQALDAQIQGLLQKRLGPHLDRVVRATSTNWMFPWVAAEPVSDQRVNLQHYAEIETHAELIAGRFPAAAAVLAPSAPIPVVIGHEMAQYYALRVGDRLPLSFMQSDDQVQAWIEITGIIRPKNVLDPFWFGAFSPLTTQSTQRWTALHSALVPADAFFPLATALFPQRSIDLNWNVLLSHAKLRSADIRPLRDQLAGLSADLRALPERVVLETGLDDILANFQAQAVTVRAPLYILIAEVVLLTLYYVTMVAALSVQHVEREFAVLRSRGASGWQLLKIQATEAFLIVVVALLSGPLLGVALVRALGWVGPLSDVTRSGWALNLPRSAWMAAGAGALLCLAGLLLPLGSALRRTIVTHAQVSARAVRPPWWQRNFLDVFILLVGLILLWRLRLYGELVVGGASRPQLDGLLLLSPLALLLGAATILLRVFPLLLRSMVFLAARLRGLSGVLALWQASRNPTHVARLVLLLTLAIALGILATGLNATLDRSELERARYIAGNDVRLVSRHTIPLVDVQTAAGVVDIAGTWTGRGTVDLKSVRSLPRFDVLAIEPYSFVGVTKYRDDFADNYMGELLGHLAADERQKPVTLPLPGQPARLGLWLKATVDDDSRGSAGRYLDGDDDTDRIGIDVKLLASQGEMITARLQFKATNPEPAGGYPSGADVGSPGQVSGQQPAHATGDDGWRYFETSLPVLSASSYPLQLHSIWLQNRATQYHTPVARVDLHLALDDLTAIDGETLDAVVFGGFEEPTQIWYLDDARSLSRFTRAAPHTGRSHLALDLSYGQALQSTGLKLTAGISRDPLPALVSSAFLSATQLDVGDTVRGWINGIEVDMHIVGTVRYFPTLFEDQAAGFIITSRDLLIPLLNEASRAAVNLNQVFVLTSDQTTTDRLARMIPDLAASWVLKDVRLALKANPLALGLRSVTFFGYVLTTALSLVGFATHFYMSARQRETLYGVMRAMGWSPRQMYGSMVLEQLILILAGLGLGTLLGILLNQITLPRLPIALGEGPPIPPFIPASDWLAVGRIYVVLAVAFVITLGLATVLLWRARIHRVLRIGQE